MPSESSRKVVSKACDACRRRKVKCDGLRPCAGCLAAGLACTFDSPRGLGGNRGARATVLNELRAKSRLRNAAQSVTVPTVSPESPLSAISTPTAGQGSFVDVCMKEYVDHIYPVVPLLESGVVEAQAQQADTSPLASRFVLAFCAYVCSFGGLQDRYGRRSATCVPDKSSAQDALAAAIAARNVRAAMISSPLSVYISFFLYGACAAQGDYQEAWYYLREATTLFMILRSELDTWYDDKARCRLFWVLVVSERSHAVRRNRPITIPVSATSPSENSLPTRGLQYLASVFRPLDEIFFAIWNGTSQECSMSWLLRLEHSVRTALPDVLEVSNEEIANVRISQFWLQTKLWELFPRFGYLSSESLHECLTFAYPIAIAKHLLAVTIALPVASLQLHGIGMTEKVFDVACALADVLPFVTLQPAHTDIAPADYLVQLTSLLSKLPGGTSKFVPLLLAKVHELIPSLVQPICSAVDVPFVAFNDPMSPDTRFVYEEEVGRALFTDLRRER